MDLKVGIWASRLGFGPHGYDLGLEVKIWAWPLGFGSCGGLRSRRRRRRRKFCLCESIGIQPLQGRCPKRRKRRRRRRRGRTFPIYVKASVIDPFGAAAQKLYLQFLSIHERHRKEVISKVFESTFIQDQSQISKS